MVADPSLRQVQALLDDGRVADAAGLLASAARSGDVQGMMELAQWLIAGTIVPRDLAGARDLLGRAGRAGHGAAAMLYASFLAAGTGGDADWPGAVVLLRELAKGSPAARAQLVLIERMGLDDDGRPRTPPLAKQLSERPRVGLCRLFATPDECRHLVEVGGPYLQPSMVVDPASGRSVPHPIRVSEGAVFGVHIEDLVVAAINRRIAAATATDYAQGEPLQLLRYTPGGEYKAHMDALSDEPNQRLRTAILYLNEGYEGGETQFLRTGLSVRARAGDLLIFDNVTPDGRADPMSLHAGAPVTSGTKLIASRWIRKGRFVFPPPKPLLPAVP